jgi:hypothetical protein
MAMIDFSLLFYWLELLAMKTGWNWRKIWRELA